MARRVFFSFHFERDAWRVGQVRNSNVVLRDYEPTPFLDSVDWESIKRSGEHAIKSWIDSQLRGTSVTVVLIGKQTSHRKWVKYEIAQSWERGNGLLGILIHNLKNERGFADLRGDNPFVSIYSNGRPISDLVRTYDWVIDHGRANIGRWIEEAASSRGR